MSGYGWRSDGSLVGQLREGRVGSEGSDIVRSSGETSGRVTLGGEARAPVLRGRLFLGDRKGQVRRPRREGKTRRRSPFQEVCHYL